jgi:hypothetical protein
VLALANAHRRADAAAGLQWLSKIQRPDGSIPPLPSLDWPGWTTPLSILATMSARLSSEIDARAMSPAGEGVDLPRAKKWLLQAKGIMLDESPTLGHDVKLVGWSWAAGTHSWQEPTAWSVLALKSLGLSQHPRTREGVKLLVNRLISTGGCNYGNTTVLGQRLRPHVEPTGLTLLALADEKLDDRRIEFSLRFLLSALSAETTPISLSYGLLGLTAFNRRPAAAADWLANQYERVIEDGASPLKIALLTLAAQDSANALLRNTNKPISEKTAAILIHCRSS